MQWNRWATLWLSAGFFWFVLAISFAPSNKVYQQGLVALLWLPTLLMAWPMRGSLIVFWEQQRLLCVSLLAWAGWALLSLVWTSAQEPLREAKRVLYIGLFMLFFPIWFNRAGQQAARWMRWAGIGMGAAAVISILMFYGLEGHPWVDRLDGLGELSHPILGAYAVGAMLILMLHCAPEGAGRRGIWALALLALLAFVALGQSRGALLATLLTLLAMPVWRAGPKARWLSFAAAVIGLLGFLAAQKLMLSRGVSYRPEIFQVALEMIEQRPWAGLGLGGFYQIPASGLVFDHSHNLLTHIAIELGLPGLALWLMVWLSTARAAWRHRETIFGQAVLGIWLFSTVAMQFDAASISGTPRAEWFITWLPVGLACGLACIKAPHAACDKLRR